MPARLTAQHASTALQWAAFSAPLPRARACPHAQTELVTELLGGVVDGTIPATGAESEELVRDVFAFLSCPAARLHSRACARAADDDDVEEAPHAAAQMVKATRQLIGQLAEKSLEQSIVPVLVSLRLCLERQRSPLTKELNAYLALLFDDSKAAVERALDQHPQVRVEIEFDIRKAKEEARAQAVQERARQQEELASTGGAATMSSALPRSDRV